MANNGLTTPKAPVPKAPSEEITAVYSQWIQVPFPHAYLDSTILNRQAAIESFYLGYLEAVRVTKKKSYQALFRWTETPSVEPGYADFLLTVFTSPPPTKDSNLLMAKTFSATADDTGMEDPSDPEEIDPPHPPIPPPPTM